MLDAEATSAQETVHEPQACPPDIAAAATIDDASPTTAVTVTPSCTAAEACGSFVEQLNSFQATHNDADVQDDALRVLGRILLNLQQNPEETRYRRLRCCNERLRSMLTEVSGGAQLLRSVGFESDGDHWQIPGERVGYVPQMMAAFTEWTTKLEADRYRRERDARIELERQKEKSAPDHFRKSVTKRAQQDEDRERLLAKIEADKREREAEARCSVPPSLHRAAQQTVDGHPASVTALSAMGDAASGDSVSEERLFIRDGRARVADPPAKPSLVRLRTPKRRRTRSSELRVATLESGITSRSATPPPAPLDFDRRQPSARATVTRATSSSLAAAAVAALSSPPPGAIVVRRYSQAVMQPQHSLQSAASVSRTKPPAPLVQPLGRSTVTKTTTTATMMMMPPQQQQQQHSHHQQQQPAHRPHHHRSSALMAATVHTMPGLPSPPTTTTTTTRWVMPGALTARTDYRPASSSSSSMFASPPPISVTTSRSAYSSVGTPHSPPAAARMISRNASTSSVVGTAATTSTATTTTVTGAAACSPLSPGARGMASSVMARYAWAPPAGPPPQQQQHHHHHHHHPSTSPFIARMPLLPAVPIRTIPEERRNGHVSAVSSASFGGALISRGALGSTPIKSSSSTAAALKGKAVLTDRNQLQLKPSFRVEGASLSRMSFGQL